MCENIFCDAKTCGNRWPLPYYLRQKSEWNCRISSEPNCGVLVKNSWYSGIVGPWKSQAGLHHKRSLWARENWLERDLNLWHLSQGAKLQAEGGATTPKERSTLGQPAYFAWSTSAKGKTRQNVKQAGTCARTFEHWFWTLFYWMALIQSLNANTNGRLRHCHWFILDHIAALLQVTVGCSGVTAHYSLITAHYSCHTAALQSVTVALQLDYSWLQPHFSCITVGYSCITAALQSATAGLQLITAALQPGYSRVQLHYSRTGIPTNLRVFPRWRKGIPRVFLGFWREIEPFHTLNSWHIHGEYSVFTPTCQITTFKMDKPSCA
jgi:hypothetical protein